MRGRHALPMRFSGLAAAPTVFQERSAGRYETRLRIIAIPRARYTSPMPSFRRGWRVGPKIVIPRERTKIPEPHHYTATRPYGQTKIASARINNPKITR